MSFIKRVNPTNSVGRWSSNNDQWKLSEAICKSYGNGETSVVVGVKGCRPVTITNERPRRRGSTGIVRWNYQQRVPVIKCRCTLPSPFPYHPSPAKRIQSGRMEIGEGEEEGQGIRRYLLEERRSAIRTCIPIPPRTLLPDPLRLCGDG